MRQDEGSGNGRACFSCGTKGQHKARACGVQNPWPRSLPLPLVFFPLVADGRLRKPRKALSYLKNVIKAKWV